ncbi:MAG: hypothetical protein ACRDAM_21115, partial [Casimicrobium sp.]
ELVNLGADVDVREGRDGAMHLHIEDADWPIRIVVRPQGRAPDARYKTRLNVSQVKQLLALSPN